MKKILIFAILGFFALALVGAISYYELITIKVNVEQPIEVTGNLVPTIDCNAGESCVGTEVIKVSNAGDEDRTITLESFGTLGITVGYVGKVELSTKDTTTWNVTDTKKATVIYTLVGETFKAEAEAELESGEVLVYAMDKDERFDNYASVIKFGDVNENLPYSSDWNADAVPNYCGGVNGFDSYEHCVGAKLWIVKDSDLGNLSEGVYPLTWTNMNDYLYETDLITYFNNANNEIVVPAGSYIEFYPTFEIDKYVDGGNRTVWIQVK